MNLELFNLFALLFGGNVTNAIRWAFRLCSFVFLFSSWNGVCCSPGWFLIWFALQDDFELLLCIPLPPEGGDAAVHHHGGPLRMVWFFLLIWSFLWLPCLLLGFPPIFLAVISSSALLLSYVPLGCFVIPRQQVLGTNMALFKMGFFVVWDSPSSEFIIWTYDVPDSMQS